MEQNPSWDSSFSGSRNSPHLWNPKFHSPNHKRLLPVHFLSHSNAAHALPFYWVFTLMLSSRLCLGLPSGHFPSGVTSKTLYAFPLCSMPATFRPSLFCLDLITWKAIGEGTHHDTPLHINCYLTVDASCQLRQFVFSNHCILWSCCVVASLYLLHSVGLFLTVTYVWRSYP